jgi:predicted DNA-binding transcriptional regulator YafY
MLLHQAKVEIASSEYAEKYEVSDRTARRDFSKIQPSPSKFAITCSHTQYENSFN